jgi:hypothetical protein
MPGRKPPQKSRYAKLKPEEIAELDRIERQAVINFKGQLDDLEKAIGMLRLGHHVGWRVLVIAHSKRTVRKYEGILGITFRDFFPPEGPSSSRSVGFVIADKLSNFWKGVSGEEKIPDRNMIHRDPIKGS